MGSRARAREQDIAIVGMACRFPGLADTPADFWRILAQGEDVVGEIGPERWGLDFYRHPDPRMPGRSYTFAAGVVDGIDRFDADFFGISPREAAAMDPQQRMLLELAWEALEDGGQVPQQLAGSDCAVYVGVSSQDYANSRIDDPASADAYLMTGGTLSIAANRLSYIFDLHGPSMSIDTACSSSLVALHQACESLRRGESSMAIAGGVNVLLTPFSFIGFSKASMLSPDGRCRAFDADGKGYVRAEGGAVLFLKPLARAKADGDPIHAVIAGSGVNSDGRTRGLSMPNSNAQERLLRDLYRRAGVEPEAVTYLEAHGTGTAAGDPQEAGAIGRALGQARNGAGPLRIGSVKTNVGHLESAAGMAGLVKAVLALEHNAIPASLHYETPNPAIDFEANNLEVVTELTPLPEGGESAVMGVNSFGFGGTNAHVVLRQHAARHRGKSHAGTSRRTGDLPIMVSARSEPALRELAGRYADLLTSTDAEGNLPSLVDVAASAANRRESLEHRLLTHGRSAADVAAALRRFASDEEAPADAPSMTSGRALSRPARVAYLFTGNGCQWTGMGRTLLRRDRVFRRAVEAVDAHLVALGGASVIEELRAAPSASRMDCTEVAQPALFALQVGLVEMLRARGLAPDGVFGHSVGEVAAAYVAGVFDLEQAVRVIHERSRAQGLTRGRGRMAAAALSPDAAARAIEAFDGRIEIAATNSPGSVTLSGPLADLEALGASLHRDEIFYRILDLDYAFHSAAMDPVREPLLDSLAGLAPAAGEVAFYSTVTGAKADGETLGADYWWDNIRRPVKLDAAARALIEDGFQLFVEIGAHPIMQGYVRENLRAAGKHGATIGTVQRDDDDVERVWDALGGAYANGASLDISRLYPRRYQYVPLPRYPWQRESFWYENTPERLGLLGGPLVHPLLGYAVPHVEQTWENQLDTGSLAYLADHKVGGAVVFPAAGFVEMALAASLERERAKRDPSQTEEPIQGHEIETFEIRAPLVLDEGEARTVRLALSDGGEFQIRSRPRLSEQPWTVNVVGRLAGLTTRTRPDDVDVELGMGPRRQRQSAAEHYDAARAMGLDYGPAFQGVVEVRPTRRRGAFARIAVPAPVAADLGDYQLHPSLLDACLQTLVQVGAREADAGESVGFLPYQFGRLVLRERGDALAYCRVRVGRLSPRSIVADFDLLDASGKVIAQIEGFRFRRMRLTREAGGPSRFGYHTVLRTRRDANMGDFLPSPTDIGERLVPELADQWYTRKRSDYYGQVLPLFDALSVAFAYEVVHELRGAQGRFTASSLLATQEIEARFVPLVSRLIEMLEEDGLVHRDGDHYVLDDSAELSSAEEIWRLVLADFPAYVPEATLAGRCGLNLLPVMRGQLDPASILRPGKGPGALEYLGDASPTFRITNLAVCEALSEIVREWPEGRRLRILELSAGSLALTADLLAVLPAERCDYVLASTDETVRARAGGEFGAHPSFAVSDLDIELDPGEHGEVAGSFDVVIASHTLHARNKLGGTLDHIRWLLTRDGLLLALERSAERHTDLIFGIESQWWSRTREPTTPESRLLTVDEWRAVLEEHGFVDTVPLSEPVPDVAASSYLYVARNPGAAEGPAESEPAAASSYLLLGDDDGACGEVMEYLAEELRGDGHRVITVTGDRGFRRVQESAFTVASESAEDFERLIAVLRDEKIECREIVHLLGLELAPDRDETDLEDIGTRRCESAVRLAQALSSGAGAGESPRLWLVTAGACALPRAAGDERALEPIPSQAPLWGLGRVLMNEHPELSARMVDLYAQGDADLAGRLLVSELREPDREDEVLLAPDARYAMRFDRLAAAPSARPDPDAQAEERPVRLDFSTPGPLSNLRWIDDARPRPDSGEIQIRVRATGLNFRDVMYAMGMLSDEAVENGFAGASLGMECAGDVVAVGPNVTGFKVGDPVISFAKACFASYVTTETTAVAHKPTGWTYEEAATVPSAFFTVYYALHHLAELKRGERILIHGAAGGVGMAAIQYARYCGAEIFATAGSEEKRDFLRLLGVEHILDSRTLSFADDILELTGGAGVDVVLNSLSGEAVHKNLSVLRPFGRFLELGKRDFYENAKMGLRPFRNNISYFGIDADQLLVERSALAGRLFREMMGLFDQGAFRPLVHRVFPAARADDAFRHMQQSRHIGKIVVSHDDVIVPRGERPEPAAALELDRDGTYVVTGGLGGFGLETARWLATRGARRLALLGRRGAESDEAREAVAALAESGVEVEVRKTDVTDVDSLAATLDAIEAGGSPIKGVVHAAMVLDDGIIRSLDGERLRRVLAPKVQGAWNLHRLTRERDLDFFVMYSSATTGFGNPGQASYVSANLYLESLAEMRRRAGLPATAVGWGPIGDAGYLARNEKVGDSLAARLGGEPLSADQALAELERILALDLNNVAVVDLDWRVVSRSVPAARSPRFEEMGRAAGDDGTERGGESLQDMIADLSEDEVRETVVRLLVEQVAGVLRLAPDKLDLESSIYDLGMDSLMAVELHMGIEDRFGISIPVMMVTEGATIAQLAGRIANQLVGSPHDAEAAPARDEDHETLDNLLVRHGEELSEDEIVELKQEISARGAG